MNISENNLSCYPGHEWFILIIHAETNHIDDKT